MAGNTSFIPSYEELVDIIVAVIALSVGFTLALSGGITGIGSFWVVFPIALVAIIISFPLHEYMHKIVAQHYGAVAAFKRSDTGIIFTLLTGALGFLFGMPGATIIYSNQFTRKEEGVVSIAGPLTNFAVFGVVFAINFVLTRSWIVNIASPVGFILYINLFLAFFNMLPLYPLDGSKVLHWSKTAYAAVMLVILAMLVLINPSLGLVFTMAFAFVIALIMSRLYRGVMTFR